MTSDKLLKTKKVNGFIVQNGSNNQGGKSEDVINMGDKFGHPVTPTTISSRSVKTKSASMFQVRIAKERGMGKVC